MNATHPNDGALLAMAQNELTGAEHARVVEHLYACQQCRSLVQDVRELSAEAAAGDEAPHASAELLSRIQRSRAVGVRVTLDAGDGAVAPANRIGVRAAAWTAFASAAAIVAMVLLSPTTTRDRDVASSHVVRRDSGDNTKSETSDALLDALSPFPAVAVAQGAPVSDGATEPLVNVDASQFRRGIWSYAEYAVTNGTLARPSRMIYTSLDADRLNGRDVWRLVETTVGHAVGVDTLWLDKATFRPVERRWHIGHLDFSEKFSASGVDAVTHMAAHGPNTKEYTNKNHATVSETGVVIAQEAQLRLALRTQKLHAKWRGVFSMPGPVQGPDAGRFGRLVLTVDGSATIKTNNDEVPCWRVISPGTQVWYVSKRSGEVVQARISIGSLMERRLDLFTAP